MPEIAPAKAKDAQAPQLTEKQENVLALIKDNKTNAEIAEALGVSRSMVGQYKTALRKLGVLEAAPAPNGKARARAAGRTRSRKAAPSALVDGSNAEALIESAYDAARQPLQARLAFLHSEATKVERALARLS